MTYQTHQSEDVALKTGLPANADPNSCATCKYQRQDAGSAWCDMFATEPTAPCGRRRSIYTRVDTLIINYLVVI